MGQLNSVVSRRGWGSERAVDLGAFHWSCCRHCRLSPGLPWEPTTLLLCSLFPVAQTVKHLPTLWETRLQSLGLEDLLEKEMATHSSILAWKIP